MSKARSNANDDIYEDLDAPPEASPPDDVLLLDDSMIVDAESDDLCIVKEILTSPKEVELKKTEKKLYLEILKSEKERRKEEQLKYVDYEEIQKKSIHLQKLISEKDKEIATLKKENTNLKMNICSLYKTSKADSVRMELLLREANEKVDDLLYKKKLPKDYFEKQSSQTLSQKHDENSLEKSSQDKAGSGKISQNRREIKNESKEGSETRGKNLNQTSGQHKRSHSNSCDSENPGTGTYSNKRQNSHTRNNPDIERLNIYQRRSLNIVQNRTSFANDKNLDGSENSTQNSSSMKTESADKKKNSDPSILQNIGSIDNRINTKPTSDVASVPKINSVQSVILNENQNADLNSMHITQSVEKDSEPSNEELFFQMQLMISSDLDTLKDPDTINLIFDNLLPDELKQWFLVYENSQAAALNKLKQSFVNSYFQQCSVNTVGSSKAPDEKSAKSQNFSFFFQPSPSCSKTDSDVIILDEVSALKNKPHGNSKEKKETSI